MKEAGPITALLVAAAIAALYSQGGAAQTFAGLILLAVLITPVAGQPSILQGLLGYLNQILTEGIRTGA